jgi:hypothetical protein
MSLFFLSGILSSTTFDLTLMIVLIRNLTLISISDVVPLPSDITEGEGRTDIFYYLHVHIEERTDRFHYLEGRTYILYYIAGQTDIFYYIEGRTYIFYYIEVQQIYL